MDHKRAFDLKRGADANGYLIGFDDFFVGRNGAGWQVVDGDARLVDLNASRKVEVLQRDARLHVGRDMRCDVRRQAHAHFVALDGNASRRVFRVTPFCVAGDVDLALGGLKIGDEFRLIAFEMQRDVGRLHVKRHGLTLCGKSVKLDIAVKRGLLQSASGLQFGRKGSACRKLGRKRGKHGIELSELHIVDRHGA